MNSPSSISEWLDQVRQQCVLHHDSGMMHASAALKGAFKAWNAAALALAERSRLHEQLNFSSSKEQNECTK